MGKSPILNGNFVNVHKIYMVKQTSLFRTQRIIFHFFEFSFLIHSFHFVVRVPFLFSMNQLKVCENIHLCNRKIILKKKLTISFGPKNKNIQSKENPMNTSNAFFCNSWNVKAKHEKCWQSILKFNTKLNNWILVMPNITSLLFGSIKYDTWIWNRLCHSISSQLKSMAKICFMQKVKLSIEWTWFRFLKCFIDVHPQYFPEV